MGEEGREPLWPLSRGLSGNGLWKGGSVKEGEPWESVLHPSFPRPWSSPLAGFRLCSTGCGSIVATGSPVPGPQSRPSGASPRGLDGLSLPVGS